jgi:integrase
MRSTNAHGQGQTARTHRWARSLAPTALNEPLIRRGKLGRAQTSCFELAETRGRERKFRAGVVGCKTTQDRLTFLMMAVGVLHEKGFRLSSVRNVEQKHVAVLIEWLVDRRYANASRATYLNHLRWWVHAVGKPHLERYILKEGARIHPQVCRSYIARYDKSLAPTGVSFDEMFGRVRAIDERVAACLLLMNTFGLRTMEAWHMRPWKVHDKKGRITIVYGTKGGRRRTFRRPLVSKELEQAVLDHARAFAIHRSDSMIPPGSTPQQARAHFYYVMRKAGFTRKDIQRTPHALRHGVALDIFARRYGGAAPARGGLCEDAKRYREAQAECAEYMGHRRPDIGCAYNGSRRQAARRSARRTANGTGSQAWIDEPTGAIDVASRHEDAP